MRRRSQRLDQSKILLVSTVDLLCDSKPLEAVMGILLSSCHRTSSQVTVHLPLCGPRRSSTIVRMGGSAEWEGQKRDLDLKGVVDGAVEVSLAGQI